MENQENIETSLTPRKNLNPNQYKWDYYLIAIPIICIILFPLGVLFYFYGRFNLHPALIIMGIYPLILLMLGLILLNVVRLLIKKTWKKKFLIIIETCLPVLFILLFYFIFRLGLWGSKDPFLCGYRDQIKSKIDIEEVQSWLKTISEEYFTANKNWVSLEDIPADKLPESLKKYSHRNYIKLKKDEFGNPVIEGFTGGAFFHWGFIIGLPDLIYSEDHMWEEFGMCLMLVQPGFYVYNQ